MEKITYCGHDLDNNGLHKSVEKVEAVLKAPRPNDVVRSFLRLINYYDRSLLILSTAIHPLTQVLTKNQEMITSQHVLTHDHSLPLRLAYDASPVGIGAVLSHVMSDGTELFLQGHSQKLSKSMHRLTKKPCQ